MNHRWQIIIAALVFGLIALIAYVRGVSGEESYTTEWPGNRAVAILHADIDEQQIISILRRTLEFINPDTEMEHWEYPITLEDLNYLRIEIVEYMRMMELRRDIQEMLEILNQ